MRALAVAERAGDEPHVCITLFTGMELLGHQPHTPHKQLQSAETGRFMRDFYERLLVFMRDFGEPVFAAAGSSVVSNFTLNLHIP